MSSQLTLDSNDCDYQIQHYQPGEVVVNQQPYRHSIVITTSGISNWPVSSANQLGAAQMTTLLDSQPELILLGCGEQMFFPSAETLAPCLQQQIPVETMTNAAACRTFSALSAEGRKVIVALILEAVK